MSIDFTLQNIYYKLMSNVSFFRHLEHSTIIYEDPQHSPLLRLSWNKQDPNYLATFSLDAVEVRVVHCYLVLITQ